MTVNSQFFLKQSGKKAVLSVQRHLYKRLENSTAWEGREAIKPETDSRGKEEKGNKGGVVMTSVKIEDDWHCAG